MRINLFGSQNRTERTQTTAKTSPKSGNPSAKETSFASILQGADYDKVTFSEDSQMDDAAFAKSAAKNAAASLSGYAADEDRVAQIKADVQSGAYRIDSMRIAEKMLGYTR